MSREQDRGRSPPRVSVPETPPNMPNIILKNGFLDVEGITIGFGDTVHCSRRSVSCPPTYGSVDDSFVTHVSIATPASVATTVPVTTPDSVVTPATVGNPVSLDTPVSVAPPDSTPVTGICW
jgi:hypothetical protein